MSEQKSSQGLFVLVVVASVILLATFGVKIHQRISQIGQDVDGADVAIEDDLIDDATNELDRQVDPLVEQADRIGDALDEHAEQDRAIQSEREWYRERAHRAEAALAERSAPVSELSVAEGGWQSPCLDGCDVGGAPRNVPQGVLKPWRDEAYRTTRKELRVNLNRAGVGRVQRNTACVETVEAELQAEYPRRGRYELADGRGQIEVLGRMPSNAGGSRSELHRASKTVWIHCD